MCDIKSGGKIVKEVNFGLQCPKTGQMRESSRSYVWYAVIT